MFNMNSIISHSKSLFGFKWLHVMKNVKVIQIPSTLKMDLKNNDKRYKRSLYISTVSCHEIKWRAKDFDQSHKICVVSEEISITSQAAKKPKSARFQYELNHFSIQIEAQSS